MNLKHNQNGIIIMPFIAGIIALALIGSAGWYTYSRSRDKTDHSKTAIKTEKNNQSTSPTPNKQSKTAMKTPSTNKPAPAPSTPPAKPATSQQIQYLTIEDWGIKIAYKNSSKSLNYKIIDNSAIYLSSAELDNFVTSHPECPEANQGVILNRILPGDSDYNGEIWEESRLNGVKAPKIGNYYYLENYYNVCSTSMSGVSFETQQAYITLAQTIPFHDSVVLK